MKQTATSPVAQSAVDSHRSQQLARRFVVRLLWSATATVPGGDAPNLQELRRQNLNEMTPEASQVFSDLLGVNIATFNNMVSVVDDVIYDHAKGNVLAMRPPAIRQTSDAIANVYAQNNTAIDKAAAYRLLADELKKLTKEKSKGGL